MVAKLRIGLAGLGTVGTGVLDLLARNGNEIEARTGKKLEVVAVTARSNSRVRGAHDLSGLVWAENPQALAVHPDVDVLVELIGGDGDPAYASVQAALAAGKSVVTANKALLAHHGGELARLADANHAGLYFEAAVAGGIPVVKTLREGLAGNQVSRVSGILNGTCNYILTKMADEGRSFDDVLVEAQKLGYAEADPTFDVGGFDAAHKLAVLTALAFGTEPDLKSIEIEGISHVTLEDIRNADAMGYKIKLLGVCADTGDGIEQRVHPMLVRKGSPIGEVDGVFNAAAIHGDFVGDLMLVGRGAGAHPTASAVLSDLCDIARGNRVPAFGVPGAKLKPFRAAPAQTHAGGYYVALDLHDRPGAVAAIAQRLAERNISIESIVQRAPQTAAETAPFILTTHDTQESDMRAALSQIEKDGYAARPPRMIRMERL